MAAKREPQAIHTNADVLMTTGPARLIGVMYTSGGGALQHINFYDNTSASGTVRLELDTTKQGIVTWNLPEGGLIFSNGIYCDIGGATSVTAIIAQ